MITFITRRLIQAVVTTLFVSLTIFLMMRLIPGDPIRLYVSQSDMFSFNEFQIQELRHEFGLDKPIIIQYVSWLSNLFHGDLGKSIYYRDTVSNLLAKRIPVTFHLGIVAVIISNLLGIPIGIISALRRGKRIDLILTIFANLGITIPIFWLGIILIYLFGLKLHWLPIFGYTSPTQNFLLSTKQIIMPVICLTVFSLAAIARQTRSSMLEVIQQDYIRTAWAKGLSERSVVIVHALKNGLIPVVTLSGAQISHILGGSVLIETIFNIPGMGRLLVNAVITLDFSVVQGVFLLMSIMVVLTNLIVDVSYSWLDPKIRY